MKKVLILGGTGGLGSQVAELMKSKGWDVVAVGSKYADITNEEQVQEIIEIHSPDILINFAGNNIDAFIHKTTQENEIKQIGVNVGGAVNAARYCLPGMRSRGYGRIILISSVLVTHNVLGTGIYSACKAFIDRLVKSISAENISKGITANSLQLGYFDGGLTYKLPDPEVFKEAIPLKRWGRIDELVNAIEFLINTEYCTGVNLPLTGGL